ncbi:hypothetical protein KY330_03045 [Candidatus Woesearchaeota archaeon]|nr:hypothetical protein [Candidatus Woesearchaeota archaeon]
MATFLDLGLLQHFSNLFPIMLVFVIVYAFLDKIKWPTDNKALNAMIALVIAGVLIVSPKTTSIIEFMAPWFVIGLVFLIFLFLLFMLFGVKEADFLVAVKKKEVYWTVIVISLIILIAAAGKTFFSSVPEGTTVGGTLVGQAEGVGEVAFWETIFHPKVLGVIFVLVVALFTVRLMSGNVVPD